MRELGSDETYEGARGLFGADARPDDRAELTAPRAPTRPAGAGPDATEQSRLFDLLGRINHLILRGEPVYLQAGGEVYKVLYGLYWQSVFTGAQHWGFRCEALGHGAWAEEQGTTSRVDLPLRHTESGWVVEVASAACLLYGDVLLGCADALFNPAFDRRG